MRNAFLGSVAVLLAGANLLWAQPAHLAPASAAGTPPAAASDQGPRDTTSVPGTSDPASTAPLLPWAPDWAVDLFGSPYGQVNASVEYLLWFNKNIPALPPLVTTSDLGPHNGEADLVGGTGASLDFGLFSGGRINLTYAAGENQCCGLEGSFLFIAQKSLRFRDDATALLGRRLFNTQTGQEDSFLLGFPGLATGDINVTSSSQTWGLEVNYFRNIINDPIVEQVRVDLLFGLRYFDVSEDLSIISATNYGRDLRFFPDFQSFAGNRIVANDLFGTSNQFFGAQVGAATKYSGQFGTVDIRTKLAIGTNHETINIRGGQLRTFANGTTLGFPGGVLAQRSNIGRFTREQFTVLPEFSANWLVPLTRCVDLSFGYTFIFLSRAIRPGDQIDRSVDVSQIPNFRVVPPAPIDATRPGVPFLQSTYYAHGISAGISFHW